MIGPPVGCADSRCLMYARDLRVGDSLPYVGQITAVRCDRETVVVKMSTFAGEQTWDGDFVVWVVRGRLW